jgi:hypothetical protein
MTAHQPEAIGFDPPAPVFRVNDEDTVIKEDLVELEAGMRAGIPNPWSETENWIIGTIRGVGGEFLIDVGTSFGKLELLEDCWKCVGLARVDAIARGLGLEGSAPQPKKFTDRLLKRAGKKKQR